MLKSVGANGSKDRVPGREFWYAFHLNDFEVIKFIGIENCLSNI